MRRHFFWFTLIFVLSLGLYEVILPTVLEDWKVGRGYSNSFPNSHTTGLVVLQSWKHQCFPESSGFIFFEWLHTVRWEKSSLLKWCNQRRLWPHPQDEQKFLFSPASMKELGTFRDVAPILQHHILADSQAGSSVSIIGSRYKQVATQTQGKNDRIKWCYSPIERCLSHKSLHLCAISQLATVEYSMVNANFADSTVRPHPLYSRWSSSPPCHNSSIMSGWSLGKTWQLLKWLVWPLYSGDLLIGYPKSPISNLDLSCLSHPRGVFPPAPSLSIHGFSATAQPSCRSPHRSRRARAPSSCACPAARSATGLRSSTHEIHGLWVDCQFAVLWRYTEVIVWHLTWNDIFQDMGEA